MVSATSSRSSRRLGRVSAGLAVLVSGALALSLTPLASAEPTKAPPVSLPALATTPGDYIVSLAAAPVAAYDGDLKGFAATRPASGRRVDVSSTKAKRYRSFLRGQQDKVAARVGAKPRTRFEIGLTGFTAKLTPSQAKTLSATDGVLSVTKNTLRQATDDRNSVDFLKLSGSNGVWSKLGGTAKSGRGVVVGVLDTGIWPESASFAGEALKTSPSAKFVPYRSGNKVIMTKSDGGTFRGVCQTGVQFTRSDCSTKIVGARYFGDAWLAGVPAADRAASEFVSPRDGGGHGSHTASTAAGNNGVQAVVDGRDFGKISGVAPAAKIAAYKVLWEAKDPDQSGGLTTDILKGIEAAITDGVDVINYSISGSDDPTDPVELMFLSAASAGIFVSASAGNSGPGASTLAHTSPWVTTVGANTVAPYYGTVSLGNGQKYAGISTSVTTAVGPAPLAVSTALVAGEQSPGVATLCGPNSLDPAKTAGKIVVCDRGTYDRVAKSAEVKRAGGIGMVLANPTDNSLDGDLHTVPTVHVNPPASAAIKTYAATAGATATLTEGNQSSTSIPYPQIAGFSSRGPSLGTGGDTLKPDLTAPGVATLAAVAPPSNSGRRLRLLLRYLDGRPARGRSGRPVVRGRRQAEVVADEDQVGVDDDRGQPGRQGRQQGHRPVRPGRRSGATEQDDRPGPGLPLGRPRLAGLPGGPRLRHRHRRQGHRPERLQHPVDRDRVAAQDADRDPSGDGGEAGSVPGPGEHPRRERVGEPVDPVVQRGGGDPDLPGHLHQPERRVRPGRQWLPDLEGCRHDGPEPAGGDPEGGRRARCGGRFRRFREDQVRGDSGGGRSVPDHRVRAGHRNGCGPHDHRRRAGNSSRL